MSALTLPKRFHPDFRVPGKKPVGAVEVDSARGGLPHPLFIHKGDAAGYGSDVNTANLGIDQNGASSEFAGSSGDKISFPTNSNVANLHRRQDITLAATFSLKDAATTLCYVYNVDLRINIGVNVENIGAGLGVAWFDGAFRSALLETTISPSAVYTLIFTKSQGSVARVYLFKNRVLIAEQDVTTSTNNIVYTARSVDFGARDTAPTNNTQQVNVYQGVLFPVALSQGQAISYGKDPYQLLKPANPYILPTTGVSPPAATPLDQYYKTLLQGGTL